ncbi:TatD family hydrolase [Thiomicrorhabdus sediminis]|uniref:TatD family deoxyribonuclease n=1 Tax=Thiomicrorhabdus sediminis TaxID=2580412 RepID=A0A4P9K3G2_9GAMM|nr:TatD family hydrolase [Thiomicrorhabdus sediminis]QCU89434.1 TatD family deoxyribonuclease [Thiomicrorhabdus sediminis]
MFDTHCHLNSLYALSASELSSCLNSKHYYLAVSSKQSDWDSTLAFSRAHELVMPALGIHPWFVSSHDVNVLTELEVRLQTNEVNALGEIGLDFQKKYIADKSKQLEFCHYQLALAERYRLPVSLHIIKAHNEALALLKQFNVTGVVHGLGASTQIAQSYLSLGFKVGINGVSCRSNARRYHELIDFCGIDNLVLETDFPNIILPEHNRAALSDIKIIADLIAKRLQLDYLQVIAKTDYNARQIFLNT